MLLCQLDRILDKSRVGHIALIQTAELYAALHPALGLGRAEIKIVGGRSFKNDRQIRLYHLGRHPRAAHPHFLLGGEGPGHIDRQLIPVEIKLFHGIHDTSAACPVVKGLALTDAMLLIIRKIDGWRHRIAYRDAKVLLHLFPAGSPDVHIHGLDRQVLGGPLLCVHKMDRLGGDDPFHQLPAPGTDDHLMGRDIGDDKTAQHDDPQNAVIMDRLYHEPALVGMGIQLEDRLPLPCPGHPCIKVVHRVIFQFEPSAVVRYGADHLFFKSTWPKCI